ncbi:probable ubiquitin-conjugating enzyme E2 25 [Cucurbita maxima]|uniref:E2 ubiquitin-conjugating enzyme n=1 Tax=Cucurbita maxima TaxID=3661 RepID=A0A6J1IZ24_CUCMA|nr:probable ubiquitin-conjugating enzyme E2 25 [Cucurbita maxima]
MEPPLSSNSFQNSKEQELSVSSSGFMKPQVLGASSIIKQPPKMLKDKGIISVNVEVIDLDDDEASDADMAMFLQDNFDTNNKGKGLYHHSDHQLKKTSSSCSFIPDVEVVESTNKDGSNLPSASHNFIDLDNYCSESSAEDDEWIPFDEVMDVDAYSALQAHFDHMDIPTDIEVPIPWLPHVQKGNQTNIETSSLLAEPQIKPDAVNQLGRASALLKLKAALANSLSLPADIDVLSHLHEGFEPFPSFSSQDIQPNMKSTASQYRDKSVSPYEVGHVNSLLGTHAAKPWWSDHLKCKKKQYGSNNSSFNQPDAMKLHNGGETSATPDSVKKQAGIHKMPHHSNFPGHMEVVKNMQPGQFIPYGPEYAKMKAKDPFFATHTASGLPFYPLGVPPTLGEAVDMPWTQGSTQHFTNIAPDNSTSVSIPPENLDAILANFESFKQFDTVNDHSDHYYSSNGFSMKQEPKKWTKKVQEEWKILEKDLPETIFVRVYESRMDLMRAVIIGAQGTPYHDGLFFFDIFFPTNYPDAPPKVHYHSGGLRLNPNLYNCGKVCLSLLNTWDGRGNEKWLPGMSTMLQVLVSIQGLILNTKPYFNEPGYEYQNGSAMGEDKSQRYNEDTFLLSIKTMVYNIRRPPKHFEDFVRGHFFKRGHDILVACKAYTDGAEVGSLVKGGVQDLDVGDKSCSSHFRHSLSKLLSMLVVELKKIGVSDCEKFMPRQTPSTW